MSSTHTDEMSDCVSATSAHDFATPEKAVATAAAALQASQPQPSLELSPMHPRLVTYGRRNTHGTQSRTTASMTTSVTNNNNNSNPSITVTSKSLAGSRSRNANAATSNTGAATTTTSDTNASLTAEEMRAVQAYTRGGDHSRHEAQLPSASPSSTSSSGTLKSKLHGLLANVVAVEDSIVRHLSSSPPAPSAARELAGPRRSSSRVITGEANTMTMAPGSHTEAEEEVAVAAVAAAAKDGLSAAPNEPDIPPQSQHPPANKGAAAKGNAPRHRHNPRRRGQPTVDSAAHATTMTLMNDVAAEAAAMGRPSTGTLTSGTASGTGRDHARAYVVRGTRSSSLRSGLTHPTSGTLTTTTAPGSGHTAAKNMYSPVRETETMTTTTTNTTNAENGSAPVQRGRSRSLRHDDPYAHVHSVVRDYRTNQIDQLAAAYRAARVSVSTDPLRPGSAELLSPPPRRVPAAVSPEHHMRTPHRHALQQQQQQYYYYPHDHHGRSSRRQSQPPPHHLPSRDAATEASMIEVSRSTSAGEANSRMTEGDTGEETARTLTMTQAAVAGESASIAGHEKEREGVVREGEEREEEEDTSSARKRAVSFHDDHRVTDDVTGTRRRPLARRLAGHDGRAVQAQTPRTRSGTPGQRINAFATAPATTTMRRRTPSAPRRTLSAAEQAALYVQEELRRQPSPYRAHIPVPTPWRPASPRPGEQRRWQREVVRPLRYGTGQQAAAIRHRTPSQQQQTRTRTVSGTPRKHSVRAHSASLVPRCASIIPARYRAASRPTTGSRTLSSGEEAAGAGTEKAFRGRAPFTVSPLPREGRVNHHRSPLRVRAELALDAAKKPQPQEYRVEAAVWRASHNNSNNNSNNNGGGAVVGSGRSKPDVFASIPPPPPPPPPPPQQTTMAAWLGVEHRGGNNGGDEADYIARPLLSSPQAWPSAAAAATAGGSGESNIVRSGKAGSAAARTRQVDTSSFQSRLLFGVNPPLLATAAK